jgi:hypothetical protein
MELERALVLHRQVHSNSITKKPTPLLPEPLAVVLYQAQIVQQARCVTRHVQLILDHMTHHAG